MSRASLALALALALPALAVSGRQQAPPPAPAAPRAPAPARASRPLPAAAIVIDTHADTTARLLFEDFDPAVRHEEGHLDIPRMREGGLDAVFLSIWVPPTVTGAPAIKRALDQIDAIREAVRHHPRDLVLATTAADIRRAHATGRIAVLMGVEGGHMIDDDLGVLRQFAALGVRYLTLTHTAPTNWADSSGAPPKNDGLKEFGRKVIRELNRLGVMVDVSHVSDKTFWDVLETSIAPVLASHSSMRALSNHPRNLTDEMLKALAKQDGVVQINYDTEFLSQAFRDAVVARSTEIAAAQKTVAARCGDNSACATREMERQVRQMMASGVLPEVSWEKIVEHVDHAVKIAGVDHVGLGSDFDGAWMPLGMEDVSQLPKIAAGLRKMRYTDAAIRKILGGNTLALMERVEAASREVARTEARGDQ